MTFSGALTITDLDDFLTPSQACIIPVRNPKSAGAAGEDGETEIQIDSNNNYYEVSTYSTAAAGPSSAGAARAQGKTALEKAEINLNDCLACSGCITSTESLLITMQSHTEVLDFINSNPAPGTDTTPCHKPRHPILSISPQTLASLAASYASSTGTPPIPLLTLLRRIRAFLGQSNKGGWIVWDTTFARHLSLLETVQEFKERKAAVGRKGKEKAMPILASACPGWVCYAEKAQGDLLPHMSAVRSSQAIIGALAKTWYAGKRGLKPDDVYHVTAMPCYDKKLEASRSDFYSSLYSTRDTDCVVTTGELDLLLSDLGFDPTATVASEDALERAEGSPWPEMITHQGSSSGSYLATLLTSIAASHPKPTTVQERQVRGSEDNVEYLLIDTVTGEAVFKGMKCYGFRNLQNLVRKVNKETGRGKASNSRLSAAMAARRRRAKTGQGEVMTPLSTDGSDIEGGHHHHPHVGAAVGAALGREEKKLDFVEVMACPGGCVNGGGQMKPVTPAQVAVAAKEVDEEGYERPLPDDGVTSREERGEGTRWSTKEWVAKVEAIYWNGLPTPPPSPTLSAQDLDVEMNGNGHKSLGPVQQRLEEADRMAEEIVRELCAAGGEDHGILRTTFKRVEGDVLGGGVTHEAVKW